MNLSDKGLEWLKGVERLHLKPYDEQTGKPLASWNKGATIGYGHLISRSEWDQYKNGITKTEAEALLQKDLARFVAAARKVRPKLKAHEFDAVVIFAYNIGVEAFMGSTVFKMLDNPSFKSTVYPTLEAAWKAWNKSQGKVMKGLDNRRAAEWDMYSRGIYRYW